MFAIAQTPLSGLGYKPQVFSEKEQWLEVTLRPIRQSDYSLLLEMDKRIYPTADPVTPPVLDAWFAKNPEFGMIYELGGKTVGVCVVIPLNRRGWEKLINGTLLESELNQETIFDNQTDQEIGLHFYHVEKLLPMDDFYARILPDLNNLVENLRKMNPQLKIIGSSGLCVTSLGLGLFQNKFNFRERTFTSSEHILSKDKKLSIYDEKNGGQEGLMSKLNDGYMYHHRCKMIVLRPEDFSLVWSYLKK